MNLNRSKPITFNHIIGAIKICSSTDALRHRCQSLRRGATAVEFALCVPIVFTVLFAGYELAHANLVQHATESAAYEAARVGIVPGALPAEVRNAAAGILNSIGVSEFDLQADLGRNPDGTETIQVEIVVDFLQTSAALQFFPWSPRMRGRCELTREFF